MVLVDQSEERLEMARERLGEIAASRHQKKLKLACVASAVLPGEPERHGQPREVLVRDLLRPPHAAHH